MAFLTAAVLSMNVTPARADCPSGQRDTTAAETATLERMVSVLPDAFPTLEGWSSRREHKPTVYKTTCLDPDGEQVASRYSVTFVETAGAKERRKKIKVLSASIREPSDVDMATRFKEIQAKSQEILRDTLIKVSVSINQRTNYAKGKSVTVPGGYPAFQTTGDKDVPGQMKTVVLMGTWKRQADGEMHATLSANAPTSRIQNVVVIVWADTKRTQSYLSRVKLASLFGLIGK